jgi:universal stress protein E
MHYRKILVGVEFPAAKSQWGLARARQLAAKSGAKLELFHAAYDPEIGDVPRPDSDARVQYVLDIRRRQLEALLRDAGLEESTASVNVCWSHSVVDALNREIAEFGADLVIAESTRRGKFARFVLTNTDWELIRHLTAPLLLVKSAKPIRSAPVLCAIDPDHSHDKPAELDEAILVAGRRFANALHCRTTVYHTYSLVPPQGVLLGRGVEMLLPQRVDKAQTAERRKLEIERAANLAKAHRIPDAKIVVEQGDPRELLPERVSAERAQVVVLGAVARSPLDRVMIGSTAEAVLDQLECDVLVVKPIKSSRARRRPR